MAALDMKDGGASLTPPKPKDEVAGQAKPKPKVKTSDEVATR
jgi:hypothetical protein